MNQLKARGLVDNVVLFPHSVINKGYTHEVRDLEGRTPLLASFGFCFPNKGLLELVEAVSILREQGQIVQLRMLNARHPIHVSGDEIERIQAAITRLGLGGQIELRTEFMEDDVCLQLLHEADLIVNPYQSTGEAASGAVRFGLASGRPVAVTPIPIFNDLGGAVFRMPGTRPSDIARGIDETLDHMKNDTSEYRVVRDVGRQWLDAHDYGRQAQRLMRMIRTLEYEAAATSSSKRD
jgi:glycosyltransferase involved in cell wall biosynthesis